MKNIDVGQGSSMFLRTHVLCVREFYRFRDGTHVYFKLNVKFQANESEIFDSQFVNRRAKFVKVHRQKCLLVSCMVVAAGI